MVEYDRVSSDSGVMSDVNKEHVLAVKIFRVMNLPRRGNLVVSFPTTEMMHVIATKLGLPNTFNHNSYESADRRVMGYTNT